MGCPLYTAVGASSADSASSSHSCTASMSLPMETLVIRSRITSTITGTRCSPIGPASHEPGKGRPGVARIGRVVAGDARLDQPVRPVGGDEDLAVVLQAEGGQVDEEVMLVRRGEPDLRDAG